MMDCSVAIIRPWICFCILLLLARDLLLNKAYAELISDGLTVDDCVFFLERADASGDSSGGVSVRNGEYTRFIEMLGNRKCFDSPGSANGPQTILFLNLVCNTIATTNCSYDAEIPLSMPDTELREVCQKVDSLIVSDCGGQTLPTRFPTFAPTTPPTLPDLEPIARGLTVAGCRSDIQTADAGNDNRLDLNEYTTFLNLMGQRVCFVPDQNFEISRNGTFSEFACLSNNPCAGATDINLQQFAGGDDLRDFCTGNYVLVLNGAECPTGPTTPVPSAAPSEAPSIRPSQQPSTSMQPSPEGPLGRIGTSSATRRLPCWSWALALLVGASLAALL